VVEVQYLTPQSNKAYYGVPEELREKALAYLDDELLSIYNEWFIAKGK
jgi:hypothetical protein